MLHLDVRLWHNVYKNRSLFPASRQFSSSSTGAILSTSTSNRLPASTTIRREMSSARPPFNAGSPFSLSDQPNVKWDLGRGLDLENGGELAKGWREDEKAGWISVDMEKTQKPDIYKFLTSAVTPRPVAFVSTISATGVPNLAPFSYFSMVAHNPPLISVSFTLSALRPKDTRENIRDTREFVVNIISEPFVEAANSCSVEAPDEIDEWVVSGLTPEPSTLVKPPRVRESAVSFECELFHYHDITPPGSSEVTNTLVLGHIRHAHVRNAVLVDASADAATPPLIVDPTKLRPVSRLGGMMYARVTEGFEIARPSWRQWEKRVREMMDKDKKEKKGE